jgi:hypothetical protein
MERKAIMKTIGIFTGKQKEYNARVLTLLYDNGPLTAWELTGKIRKVGRQSLHSTLNKRLRSLEKKGYVRRKIKKWLLSFKGIIAVLLIQPKPKMWNQKWTELFEKSAKNIEDHDTPILGMDKDTVEKALKSLGFYLDDFNAWIGLSKKVKSLMEKGVINLDVIEEKTLLSIILMETMTLEQLSELWNTSKSILKD